MVSELERVKREMLFGALNGGSFAVSSRFPSRLAFSITCGIFWKSPKGGWETDGFLLHRSSSSGSGFLRVRKGFWFLLRRCRVPYTCLFGGNLAVWAGP